MEKQEENNDSLAWSKSQLNNGLGLSRKCRAKEDRKFSISIILSRCWVSRVLLPVFAATRFVQGGRWRWHGLISDVYEGCCCCCRRGSKSGRLEGNPSCHRSRWDRFPADWTQGSRLRLPTGPSSRLPLQHTIRSSLRLIPMLTATSSFSSSFAIILPLFRPSTVKALNNHISCFNPPHWTSFDGEATLSLLLRLVTHKGACALRTYDWSNQWAGCSERGGEGGGREGREGGDPLPRTSLFETHFGR